jgi:hypothetical protein
MRNLLAITLLLALASNSALALESATTGSQATQATVGAINSKVDVTNNFINSMMKCNAARKFYAPSDPKKDADGCVGVGDYDLNMASGSNVNLANGLVNGAQTGTSNWTGLFSGPSLGLLGKGGSYGVYGYASGSSSGDSVGVYGYAATSTGWGGYFYSPASGGGGVMIYNAANNARLCLNGSCTTSLPSTGYYTIISGYYYRTMSRTNSSGRGMMVMASGGSDPYCSGNYANPYNLNGYVNGNWVTYASDSNIEYSKAGHISFFVPNGSSYTVTSAPYGCGVGYFYVSEALI